MFDRDFMPRSNDTALEQRECRLHGIRSTAQSVLITYVLIDTVIQSLMSRLAELRHLEIVEFGFVRHDDIDTLVHISRNNLVHLFLSQIIRINEVEMSAALPNADNGGFLTPLFLIRRLSAYVSFVNLDLARQLVALSFLHGSADSVTQIPRGFVANSQSSLELVRAHSFARFTEQVSAQEPLPQWQMRVMEDRASRDAELIVARIAIILCAIANVGRLAATGGARRAIGPAQRLKIASTFFFVAELLNQAAKVYIRK